MLGCDALDAVESLRDASILHGGPHAMHMLDSVRAYGRERLDDDAAHLRHFAWAIAREPPPVGDLEDAAGHALSAGDHERAARALLRAHSVLRTREAPSARAQRLDPVDGRALAPATRARLALARSETGSPDALALAQQALDIAGEIGDAAIEIDARHQLSVLMYMRGEDELALAHATRALALGPDPSRAGPIEASLGVSLHMRGRHDEARAHYERALALALAAPDPALEARALGRLGFLALDLGRHDDAEAHLTESLAVATATGDAHAAALARGYLGNVMRYRQRLAEAREHYDAAIEQMGALGDRRWVAVFTMDLGILWLDHLRATEATAVLESALTAARAVGNARVQGLVEGYLAAACACAGDTAGFDAHLAAAGSIAPRVAGLAEVIEVHALHARLGALAEIGRGRHGHAELAARIVRARAAPESGLRISADRARLELDGARIDLSSYGATRRVFALLLEERIERRGSAVSTGALIGAGWPGERLAPRAALNRLRVAVAQLRRAGLSALQTVRGGYRLDPDLHVSELTD